MNPFYLIQESLISIKQHKKRNVLTGFGIAWAMFILVFLLGVGAGFENGMKNALSGMASNTIWMWGGMTSSGNEKGEGKRIQFTLPLLQQMKEKFSNDVEFFSPSVGFPGVCEATYKTKIFAPELRGVEPDFFKIILLKIKEGRNMNYLDSKQNRPVCILGNLVKQNLFGNNTPIGKQIQINGMWFTVIGYFENASVFDRDNDRSIFIPYGAFQTYFNIGFEFSGFCMLMKKDAKDMDILEKDFKKFFSQKLGFSPKDDNAIQYYNFKKELNVFDGIFIGIKIFMWFVGLCLLLSGVVGIGNMMLVTVNERTSEIGIRRAIGATPKDILWMFLTEAIVITLIAGLFGMFLGTTLLSTLNFILNKFLADQLPLLKSLNVEWSTLISALITIIITGIIAGYIPSKKATKIMPVEALNKE